MKQVICSIIWFTDPITPYIPVEKIKLFLQDNADIQLWTTAALIPLINQSISNHLKLNPIDAQCRITLLAWENFKTKPQFKNSCIAIDNALSCQDWSCASDHLRIMLLEQSSKPMIYLDMKIGPKENKLLSLSDQLLRLGYLYNSNMCLSPENHIGGRNNIHYTNGSPQIRLLFGIARIIAEYVSLITHMILPFKIKPHALSTLTTGHAIAFAINAYTSRLTRLSLYRDKINEDLYFKEPTGGHEALSAKQLSETSGVIENLLRTNPLLFSQMTATGPLDLLMRKILVNRQAVLKDRETGLLLRGSIYPNRSHTLFGPWEDGYIPTTADPLPENFLDSALASSHTRNQYGAH